MKSSKVVILSLTLALAFSLSPVSARAQTPTVEEQIATIQAQVNQLMELLKLIQQIEALQAQIVTLSAQQATQATQLGAVQTSVNQVVENTAPKLGVVIEPTTVVIGTPACSTRNQNPSYYISDAYPVNSYAVGAPFTTAGGWKEIKFVYNRYPITAQQNNTSYILHNQAKQREEIVVTNPNNQSQLSFGIQNYPDTYEVTVSGPGIESSTQNVVVSSCQ